MHGPGLLTDESSRLQAIALMCTAIVIFSVLDASAKYVVTIAAIPVVQIMWMRFFCHLILNFAVLGPKTFAKSMRSARPGLQFLRSVLLATTTGFNFLALQYLQLDQIATIFFLTPFVVAILAGPLLDEWIGWRRLLAIMVGFSGVILVVRPGFGGIHWAVIYSFGATIFYALYTISTRYLARHDESVVTQVYTPIAGSILLAPMAYWFWIWPPDTLIWLLMISTGISGGIGHYMLILAHRRAPAPILAPFTYIGLVSQSLMGYLVFADLPSKWTLAGGIVIVSSGLYLIYRERRVVKAEGPAAASLTVDIRN